MSVNKPVSAGHSLLVAYLQMGMRTRNNFIFQEKTYFKYSILKEINLSFLPVFSPLVDDLVVDCQIRAVEGV